MFQKKSPRQLTNVKKNHCDSVNWDEEEAPTKEGFRAPLLSSGASLLGWTRVH